MAYNAIFLKRVPDNSLKKTLKTISLIATVDCANDLLTISGFYDVSDILFVSRFIINVYLSLAGIKGAGSRNRKQTCYL